MEEDEFEKKLNKMDIREDLFYKSTVRDKIIIIMTDLHHNL